MTTHPYDIRTSKGVIHSSHPGSAGDCAVCGRDNDNQTHDALETYGHLNHGYQPLLFDLIAHLYRQREFSERTFGPGDRTEGVIDHIRKELVEVAELADANADTFPEWVDVIILGLDGAWRSGASPEQIVEAITAKQARNEGRTWPDWRAAPASQAIEHIRTEHSE